MVSSHVHAIYREILVIASRKYLVAEYSGDVFVLVIRFGDVMLY